MIYIKILKKFNKHKVGTCLRIKGGNGVCSDPYWRRRVADSKTDKCLEILKKKPKRFLNG